MPELDVKTAEEILSTKSLFKQVNSYIETLEKVDSADGLTKNIITDFRTLVNLFIASAEQQIPVNIEDSSVSDEMILLHYELSEPFKDVNLLYRDVMLQLQISKHKYLEQLIFEEQIILHFKASKDELLKATKYFLNQIETKRKELYGSEKSAKQLYKRIKHRENPWKIYKAQYQSILIQLREIAQSAAIMVKTIKIFRDIKSHNAQFLEAIANETATLKNQLGEGIRLLKTIETPEQLAATITWIDTATKQTVNTQNLQDAYMATVELKIKMLNEATITVATTDGLLLTRKLNFNKTVNKWIDFEILPLLIDVMENKNAIVSFFNHNLLNLKTGLVVEKNNSSLAAIPAQLNALKSVHETLSNNVEHLKTLKTEIHKKFDLYFQATQIYSKDDFLEVSFQSSLSQFASEQNTLFSGLKKKWQTRFARFNSKYEVSLGLQSQNKIELATACISYRMFKEENAQYDTLFLNKNFIGDLFILPRNEQELRLVASIKQWENGFNKAILITGDALSGKTTFINTLAQSHFAKNNLVLKRDSTMTFGGRKFTTSANLTEALQNIKKGLDGRPVLLVIDDLELWGNVSQPLISNVRALINFIENQGDEVLVVVTTTKHMRSHLDQRLHFTSVFTNRIDLNKTTFLDIHKAILLRHGAAHKTLVGKDNVALSNNEIEKEVLKLAKTYDYNIGEVLQAWTYGTTMTTDNRVIYEQKHLIFGDFFTPEEVIILKYALLYKIVNELTVKNFVGSRYETSYKSALKRLVNTKVLLRGTDGALKLNGVIQKEVKQLLIYKGLLN